MKNVFPSAAVPRTGTLVALVGLTACASLPEPDPLAVVNVEDVVKSVQCELATAHGNDAKLHKLLMGYNARAELELKLAHGNKLNASALLVLPQAPETVTASLGVGASASSTRKTNMSFNMQLGKISSVPCKEGMKSGLPSTPLSLGLKEWVQQAFSAAQKNGYAQGVEATYNLEFVLAKDASGGVSVVAYRITNASVGASAGREDRHTLTVALAPVPPPPSPMQIAVVNWPSSGPKPGAAIMGLESGAEKAAPSDRKSRSVRRGFASPQMAPDFSRVEQLIQIERLKRITIER